MTLTYGSTFAGIGGFDLGFDRAGMRPTVQIERDKNRLKILAERWPDVPKGDDVKSASGQDLGRPDVLVGGFPCKNLSIGKGNRKGLESDDSGLYWEFQRLVDEHLRLVDESRPRWTVLENVPGLLTFNGGRDMAAVVLGLESLGYGWSYRVVDCRSLGSAQRRPRVVIVGHRGGDPRPAWEVLADREGRGGHPGVRPEPPRLVSLGTAGTAAPDSIRVFRKSARPRTTAEKGGYATYKEDGFYNTLTNNDSGSPVRQTHIIAQAGRLRALTPVEWERLMGFPDDWTAPAKEAERYKALGDAMHVDLAYWLGRRLVEVDTEIPLLSVVR